MEKNKKLGFYHKVLIFIYIISIPIPFGISILLFVYAVLHYVFKMPLKRERELLRYVYRKVLNYINKIK
mgnify:CR=1 FL=1|jgi:hypothetical protein